MFLKQRFLAVVFCFLAADAHFRVTAAQAFSPAKCAQAIAKSRVARIGTLAAALLYAVPHAYLYRYQRDFVFEPTHRVEPLKEKDPATGLEPFRSADGAVLGYVRHAEAEPKRVLLYFMGNAGEILDWGPTITSMFADKSTTLVAMEYPGYGGRPGTPSQDAFYRAGLELYDAAKARWPNVPVNAYGYSMGGSVATYVAAHRDVGKLALVSPFHSLAEVAQSEYPFMVITPLVKDPFPTYRFAQKVSVPVLIIHGNEDALIPVGHAQRLVKEFSGTTRLLIVPDVGHSLTYDEEGKTLSGFLTD